MLRGIVRRIAKRFGYQILGYPRAYAAQASLMGLLRGQDINLVLDIGANEGQFAEDLRASGYTGRIFSFEPQASAHERLCKRAEGDAQWTVFDRTAVGAENGKVDINISGNSVSSSILAMLPSHSETHPQSKYVGTESVPVRRLDDLYELTPTDRVLLKMDVQGYERQVLEGALRILRGCRAVLSELSLVPLYEGQSLAKELWDMLTAMGFEVWSVEPGIYDPESGRLLQLDGVFVRAEKI